MVEYSMYNGLPYIEMEDKYHFDEDNAPVRVKLGIIDQSNWYAQKYEVFWDYDLDTVKLYRTDSKKEAFRLLREWLSYAIYCAK